MTGGFVTLRNSRHYDRDCCLCVPVGVRPPPPPNQPWPFRQCSGWFGGFVVFV